MKCGLSVLTIIPTQAAIILWLSHQSCGKVHCGYLAATGICSYSTFIN
jgi:hypothetical protein